MDMAVEEIADADCSYIEPAFIKGYVDFDETAFSPAAAARLSQLVAGSGLSVNAVSAHLDLSQPGSAEALVRRIDFAADLGASFLITNTGPAMASDAIRAAVEASIPTLEANGLILALENPGHGRGNLTGTLIEASAFLSALGSRHVRFNYDAGNVFTYSHGQRQPADDYQDAPRWVAHAHLKDVRSDGEDWLFCSLGKGDVELHNLWQLIPRDLPVSIELPLRLQRLRKADPSRFTSPVDMDIIRECLAQSLRYISDLDSIHV